MKKLLALVLVACMILALGATAFADEGDLIGISMPTKSLERWNRDGTYPPVSSITPAAIAAIPAKTESGTTGSIPVAVRASET